MAPQERRDWLRLSLTPGLGAADARNLLTHFGLPGALYSGGIARTRIAQLAGTRIAALLDVPPGPSLRRAEDWLDARAGRFLVCMADSDYPAALLQLRDPPLVLYGTGRRELLAQRAFAIVGSRSATGQGAQNAAAFAASLSRSGLCVVSGLAEGIDAAAHTGALDSGAGTIALLGTGLDRCYPAANQALSARIGREGLLLTEFALGSGPQAWHFPLRNRLIAALSCGVLVVEAALRSGSLITARLAGELGREVFAIPGSIHAPLARGCHRLIRDGAKLVESAQDILEELHWPIAGSQTDPNPAAAGAAAAGAAKSGSGSDVPATYEVLRGLGHDPVDIDTLARRLNRSIGEISAHLLELEMAGQVERLAGNRYQRLDRDI